MNGVWCNRIEVDYEQLSLLAASYFILNYDDMALSRGRYIYDLNVKVNGCDIIITAIYLPSSSNNSEALFSFKADSVDTDLHISFRGAYDIACSFAKDFIEEYLSRVQ